MSCKTELSKINLVLSCLFTNSYEKLKGEKLTFVYIFYFRYLVGQKLVNYEHGKRPAKTATKPKEDAE